MWPSLVLVEGFPGSGKSTTAQWLAHELGRQGRPARWIYEGETPHPVFGAARGPHASWKAWLADRLAAWAGFAAAARTATGVTVLESAFLQASVFSTLRRGLDPDTVLAYLDRVADVLRPLDPALVYFPEAEPATAFRRTCDARGVVWTLFHLTQLDTSAWAQAHGVQGMPGLLAYWAEHASVSDAAVGRAGLRTLRVEAGTGDWAARRRRVAEFLGLGWPPGAEHAEPALERFAGKYRSESGRELSLTVHEGSLVTDGLLWRANRLLPRAPTVFDAEAWPFRLTFETDAAGAATRFRLEGPALQWGRLAGVYARLA